MTISQATLNRVRYHPELLPDAGTVTMVATVQTAAQIMLRRFTPQVIRFAEFQQPAVNAEMRITTDNLRHNVDLNSIAGVFDDFNMEAIDHLDFAYLSTAGAVAHTYIFGLWVDKMTVANKIARGLPLSAQEQAIASKRSILNSVEKGILPLPTSYQLQREYRPIQEYTRARRVQLAGGVTVALDTIQAEPGEALILTGFLPDSGAIFADNARFIISRDDDDTYIDFPCWPVSGAIGTLALPVQKSRIPCWIPAVRQLRLFVSSTNAIANFDVAYTVRRIKLSNALRARWGLGPVGTISEADWQELQEAVQAGIL